MLKERVVKWNRDRYLLDTFNPELERRMLSEEAREFYHAETLAHKLAEYADFLFVFEGTKAKYGCNSGIKNPLFDSYLIWKELRDWAKELQQEMHLLLVECIKNAGFYNITNSLIEMALTAVCSCNELKGFDKESGKVKKGANYKNPADIIKLKMGEGDIYVSF